MSTLVIVGGGPRATGTLLALAAELRARPADLDIHVIDPFPVGGGRIWRTTQDKVLWMNSTAAEITIYAPDPAVTPAAAATPDEETAAAPVTGPDLASWFGTVTDRDAGAETFIPRRDLSAYLSDAVDRARTVLESVPGVHLWSHQATVTDIRPGQSGAGRSGADSGGREVVLDDGTRIDADVVLLAQGHLDVASATQGQGHQPPGFTADTDWSSLPAGENILVRGMGLAFIDLMMLVTEGRGGTFLPAERNPGTGVPTYVPSGEEPVLWVGSRRGVPYRSKLTAGPLPVQLRYLPAAAEHAGADGLVGRETLERLLEADLVVAWYEALARHHPERTGLRPGGLRRLVHTAVADGVPVAAALADTVRRLVPDPADHYRPDVHNAPLAGQFFAGRAELEEAVVAVVRENLDRATGERHRQDGALYGALVAAFFTLHQLAADGLISDADRRSFLVSEVTSAFSYTCSGPPPQRLANLLALHRAGLVRFLGPELSVVADGDGFTASSPAVPEQVHAARLVDARLADFDARRVTDPLLRSLIGRGEVTASSEGFLVDGDGRALGSDGTPRADLFIVGPASASSTHVPEAFGRPGQPARVFTANARLAEVLLSAVHVGTPVA